MWDVVLCRCQSIQVGMVKLININDSNLTNIVSLNPTVSSVKYRDDLTQILVIHSTLPVLGSPEIIF